jgi:hypothetical protein
MTDGGETMTDGGETTTDGGATMTDGGATMTDGGATMTDGGATMTDGGATCGMASTPTLPSTNHDPIFWQPEGSVYAVAWSEDSTKLVVGGSFTSVKSPDGAMTRSVSNLVVLDATTGEPIDGYPSVSGGISDISVSGDTVYVVGNVLAANGTPRKNAFSFSLSSKAVLAWAPSFDVSTTHLQLVRATATEVFVEGYTSAGGTIRGYVAALNPMTGAATAWTLPDLPSGSSGSPATFRSIAVASDRVFLGGSINVTGSDGVRRKHVVALDRTTGALLPWSPAVEVDDAVYALQVAGDKLVIGTAQSGLSSIPSLVVVDARTGAVCWQKSLQINQKINRVAVARGVVFAGGLTGMLFTSGSAYKAFALGSGDALTWGADWYGSGSAGNEGEGEDVAVASNGAVAIGGARFAIGSPTTNAPKVMVFRP